MFIIVNTMVAPNGRQDLVRYHGIQMQENRQKLTHWGRVTHICVSNLTIIGSDNGLSPGRRQAITWSNVAILLIGPLGTNFSEILIEIHTFSLKKIHLKMSPGKWRPFCLGLNVFIFENRKTWVLQKHAKVIWFKVYTNLVSYDGIPKAINSILRRISKRKMIAKQVTTTCLHR